MSRLSNSRVTLSIAAEAVQARLERGWRKPTQAALGERSPKPEGEQPDRIAALSEAVHGALADVAKVAPLAGVKLNVGVDDALAHLDVAAGEFAGCSDAQLDAIALACVSELKGESAAEHVLRWQLQTDGRHLILCALRRDLIDAIEQAAKRHGLELCSIQARFFVEWNRHARGLRHDADVFAVASLREAVVACMRRGVIRGLSCGADPAPVEGARHDRVDRMLRQLGLGGQLPAGPLDSRVDRLLTGLGLEPDAPSSFVLSTRDETELPPSARWTVLAREQETA